MGVDEPVNKLVATLSVCMDGAAVTAGGRRRRKVDVLPLRQLDRTQSILVTLCVCWEVLRERSSRLVIHTHFNFPGTHSNKAANNNTYSRYELINKGQT